jgi:hypothetical protein
LAIVVPAWSLVLAFVAGLAVGYVVCRLTMSRASSTTEALPPATPTEPSPPPPAAPPEPVQEEPTPEAAPVAEAPAPEEPAPEEPAEAPAEEPAEAPAEVAAEIPASAVDNVVAELERRVKGRQGDGEADRTTGRRRK